MNRRVRNAVLVGFGGRCPKRGEEPPLKRRWLPGL